MAINIKEMKVVHKVKRLKSLVKKSASKTIGLVPTMGALHDGHLSLVKKAIESSDVVVVSIYVNPTQFNDKSDYARYPHTVKADIKALRELLRAQDIVFVPTDEEMYPEPDTRHFDFGKVEQVMEGPLRPGHFNGVGQIVSKLFMLVEPDKAFFGLKDFQQVAVIKNLVKQLGMNIEIVPCPIIREKDGLAMSSRNRLLEADRRAVAPIISKAIYAAAEKFGKEEIAEIKKSVVDTIDGTGLLKVEYFEVVDDTELVPIYSNADIDPSKKYYGCVAVQAGAIRLIDNVAMN